VVGIDRLLGECIRLDADGRGQLTLASTLQGFPDTAHGGGVLAAFDLAALHRLDGSAAERTVAAQIQRSVPLGTSLPLRLEASDGEVSVSLGDDARPLARGRVRPVAADAGLTWEGWSGPPEKGQGVPTARGCLACGTENPVGLRVGLRFDERSVWTEYRPRETYRGADGRIAPALFTVLLDEMAWWLGALATGEAGVTTDIRVTLHRPAHPGGDRLLAVGARERVTPLDARGRYWRTETAVLAADATPLASGAITFAGSRAYSRRLVPQLLRTNPPESVRAIFPAHVP
jgi:hypothetical protein